MPENWCCFEPLLPPEQEKYLFTHLFLEGLSHEKDFKMLTEIYRTKLKYTFGVIKSSEQLKNSKNGPVPYLGLELTTCSATASVSYPAFIEEPPQ
jgi:hypothetical protein